MFPELQELTFCLLHVLYLPKLYVSGNTWAGPNWGRNCVHGKSHKLTEEECHAPSLKFAHWFNYENMLVLALMIIYKIRFVYKLSSHDHRKLMSNANHFLWLWLRILFSFKKPFIHTWLQGNPQFGLDNFIRDLHLKEFIHGFSPVVLKIARVTYTTVLSGRLCSMDCLRKLSSHSLIYPEALQTLVRLSWRNCNPASIY